MNATLSSGMPTLHYSSETMVPTEDLSNMSVEELQAELIRTRQAFHSAGAPSLSIRTQLAYCMLIASSCRLMLDSARVVQHSARHNSLCCYHAPGL